MTSRMNRSFASHEPALRRRALSINTIQVSRIHPPAEWAGRGARHHRQGRFERQQTRVCCSKGRKRLASAAPNLTLAVIEVTVHRSQRETSFMSSRRPLIAGNWKMNGLRQEGLALAGETARASGGSDLRCDLLICPPFTLIGEISQQLGTSTVAIGGQDCHAEAKGAHTGDVSAEMLADL